MALLNSTAAEWNLIISMNFFLIKNGLPADDFSLVDISIRFNSLRSPSRSDTKSLKNKQNPTTKNVIWINVSAIANKVVY